MLQFETRRFCDLEPDELALWRNWVASNPNCRSPFMHPEFARAFDQCEKNVEVVVAMDGGQLVALLPFQRVRGFSAIPVGGHLSDHQGWICAQGQNYDLTQLPRVTEIGSFRFHMLPLEENVALEATAIRHSVVHADLSNGYEGYVARKKEQGSNLISKLGQKERKVTREVGEIELTQGFTEEAFSKLLQWKSIACKKRNVRNSLSSVNTHKVLLALTQTRCAEFRYHFSSLTAGGEIIAVHFGLVCHDRMAAWLPAFNPMYHRYSPGLLILLLLIRESAQNGITRIDFGNGELDFKERFMTDRTTMLEGSIDKSAFSTFIHSLWIRTKKNAKASPFQRTLQAIWYYANLSMRN